jgi:16S rRNA (cytidine1402-2'-O)-methyltransferase
MSASLRVVATPIGNLGDLSPRAVAALSSSTIVLAEDTRHTRPLLEHYGVHARLVSCHQHNESERVSLVTEALTRGESVALVSDAGAPGVSDPGGRLVDLVRAAGHRVEVFPGPSAVIAAIMGAGLVTHRFAFLGFLPKRKKARDAMITGAAKAELALVIFEAPSRVEGTLADLHRTLGARRVVVARELTKRFETFHVGALGMPLAPPFEPRGEIVIVVEAHEAKADVGDVDEDDASKLARLRRDRRPIGVRAKELATAQGLSRRDAYALLISEPALDDGACAREEEE